MSGGFLGGVLSDMGEGISGFSHDLTNGSFSDFVQHIPEGLWQDVNGGWGGLGTMLGSFFGQNNQMPGLRILWAPLLAAGGAALAGGAAAGGTAGGAGAGAGAGSSFVGDIPLAGEGGTSIYSGVGGGGSSFVGDIPLAGEGGSIYEPGTGGAAGGGNTSTTPQQNTSSDFWQRYLRDQAINQGIKQGGSLLQGGSPGGGAGGGGGFGGFISRPQAQRQQDYGGGHGLYGIGAHPALTQYIQEGYTHGRNT